MGRLSKGCLEREGMDGEERERKKEWMIAEGGRERDEFQYRGYIVYLLNRDIPEVERKFWILSDYSRCFVDSYRIY